VTLHTVLAVGRVLAPGDPDYPASLRRLARPPERLRARGVLPTWDRAVAIVGTRRASERGLALARELARALGSEGCVIVSGGASGIDHAAHLGALDAGAPTVVVHASGLSRPYPAAHGPLFARVVRDGGCELSELDDDERPRRHTFLDRNRIVAALSRAVVVVEAPLRSGALSTAAQARAVGVPLLAVPRVPPVPEAEGSNALLRGGAAPCLDASDVLSVLRDAPAYPVVSERRRGPARPASSGLCPTPRAPHGSPEVLGPSARAVADALARGPADLEQVAERTGLGVAALQAAVAELELLGALVVSSTGQLELLG
jgi:DNA processing protein